MKKRKTTTPMGMREQETSMTPREEKLIPLEVVQELIEKKTFKLENLIRKVAIELM